MIKSGSKEDPSLPGSQHYTFFHGDQYIDVVYERDGKTHETTITPRCDKEMIVISWRILWKRLANRTKGGQWNLLVYTK